MMSYWQIQKEANQVVLFAGSVIAITFGPSNSDSEVSTNKELEENNSLMKAIFRDGDTSSHTQILEFFIITNASINFWLGLSFW